MNKPAYNSGLFSIQYDCYNAPLEFDNIAYSWWNDRNGNAKYFWSGGSTNVHTCQCGIDNNCIDTNLECNCDAAAPLQLVDSGKLRLNKLFSL